MPTNKIRDSQFCHYMEDAVSMSSSRNLLHFNPDPLSWNTYTANILKRLYANNSRPAVVDQRPPFDLLCYGFLDLIYSLFVSSKQTGEN